MKKCVLCLFFCLFLCGCACAETAYIDGRTASRVHLRNAPSQQAESMGLFYSGTNVLLENSTLQDEWVRVNIGMLTGFVKREYLSTVQPEQIFPVCRVKSTSLNMRAEPLKQSEILKVLEHAEQLTIMGQTADGWFYVLDHAGTSGYVMTQYVNLTGESVDGTEIRRVGEACGDLYIFSWCAPNGQTLYFCGRDDPMVKMEDINFDGREDAVITIIRGASNFFTEFFVYDNGQYVYTSHPGEENGFCNYRLYPEYGIVRTTSNNGYAGALHEEALYRWEGTQLKCIRRAVSEENCVMTDMTDGFSLTYDTNTLNVRVWDYLNNTDDGALVYEALIDTDDIWDHQNAFAGEKEALWRGIR